MGTMKNYKQLVKSLPNKTIVFAFGRFNPPTSGHELLVKAVKKLASMHNADHAIYASKTQNSKKDPLSLDKKIEYLNLLFPNTNFIGASQNIPTFIHAVKELNKKYKNLIMVAGSDRVSEYKSILDKYNGKEFNYIYIQVISAGERDPDADNATGMSATKLRSIAAKGDLEQFKKGLPSHIRDLDSRRLMNDIRVGLGLDIIKEQIKLSNDEVREAYYRGDIFHEGEIVESNGQLYTIIKRGSNHLLVEDETGMRFSKWIKDVNQIENISENLTKKTIKTTDKLKVARIIATFLGNEDAEKSSNPEQLINIGLRKIKNKALRADSLEILQQMLSLATEAGIKFDSNLLPQKLKETVEPRVVKINTKSKRNGAGDIMSYKDFKKSLAMNNSVSEDVYSADYKVNPETGRKHKARRIYFANSGLKDKLEPEKVKESIDTDDLDDLHIMNPDGSTYDIKKWAQHGKVGHSMGGMSNDDQLRRRKVMYKVHEEVDLNEDEMKVSYKDWLNQTGKQHSPENTELYKKTQKKEVKEVTQITGDSSITTREEKKKIKYPIRDDSHQLGANNSKGFDAFFEESEDDDFTEDDLEKMANEIDDDDYLEIYDDDELAIVDDETGEIIHESLVEELEALNEVLSRVERIKAKIRFARTKAKRQRKIRIALKRHSDVKTINKRARKLAIVTLKKRLAKKPLRKMSVGEKERVENLIAKRKSLIDRLAMRLAPKVRRIEQDRLAHKKVTKK